MGHDWSIVGIRCRTFSSAGNRSRMGVQIWPPISIMIMRHLFQTYKILVDFEKHKKIKSTKSRNRSSSEKKIGNGNNLWFYRGYYQIWTKGRLSKISSGWSALHFTRKDGFKLYFYLKSSWIMSHGTPFLDHKWEGVVKILKLEFLMRIKVESQQKARSNLSRWYQDRTHWPIRSSGRESGTCSRWTGNRDYQFYESARANRFINAKRTLFWFVNANTRWQTLHWQWNSSQM